jgi:homoserine kinase
MMDDKLHQAYRLAEIRGAEASLNAARALGAAVALSGAGPSLIAFAEKKQLKAVEAALLSAFQKEGIRAKARRLRPALRGCLVVP